VLRQNEKAFISTQEIFTRIAPVIGNNAEQTPRCSPILYTGDNGGQFVFVASDATVIHQGKTALIVNADVNGAVIFLNDKQIGVTPSPEV